MRQCRFGVSLNMNQAASQKLYITVKGALSAVPSGLGRVSIGRVPRLESLGYFQLFLRNILKQMHLTKNTTPLVIAQPSTLDPRFS
jgi:hypothetical protein